MTSGVQFGRIPSALIRDGILARLKTRSEIAVYLALGSFVNGATWKASPSIETLLRITGASKRSIQRAIARLSEIGLIRVKPGGGRRKSNEYTLVTDLRNPATHDGVSESETPSPTPPFNKKNPVSGDHKPRHPEAETPSPVTVNPVTAMTPEQSKQKNRLQQSAADVRSELRKNGIESPTDTSLIRDFPGMRPEHVRESLAGLSPNAGAGLRVNELRQRLPGLLDWERAKHRLRTWLHEREPEYAARCEAQADAIAEQFQQLDAPGRAELERQVGWWIGHRLREDPETADLPDKLDGTIRNVVDSWWETSDRSKKAYRYMGLAALEADRKRESAEQEPPAQAMHDSGRTEPDDSGLPAKESA